MVDSINFDPRLRAALDPEALARMSETQQARQAEQQARTAQEVPSFGDTLKNAIEEVNELRLEADKAIEDLATGETTDVQGTILAMEKAGMSFKLMMEMRNKLVSAYQEVMRTQV